MACKASSCPSRPLRRNRSLLPLLAGALLAAVLVGCEKAEAPIVKNDAELKAETEKSMQRMMQEQSKAQPPPR
jgi:hypothetical protein